MITITYIIPTLGRSTLARAVDGVLEQLTEVDQLFVIGDGQRDEARKVMFDRQRHNVYYLEHGPTGHYGSEQVDYASGLARGDYLCYLGDDDVIAPDAISTMRDILAKDVMRPHLFAMITPEGDVRKRSVDGMVSGQQIVVPNIRGRLPVYHKPGTDKVNDRWFIERVVLAWADVGIAMHDEVIAHMPRAGRGEMF